MRVQLAGAHRLHERLLERAADRHRLADALHLRGEAALHVRKLLECEAGDLHDRVVDRRLERGGRAARDVVWYLLERVADGEAGRDLRDREARRLRGKRGGPRHARVHLDHDDVARVGVDGELDVGAARLDPDGSNHRKRLVSQRLVGAVAERLLWRDRHAVAGVNAHRVDVLDRADDERVVVAIAHHLELELAPAEQRLLEQDLVDRARVEALRDALVELGPRPRDPATVPAEREGGPHDERQAELVDRAVGLRHRCHDRRARHLKAGLGHGLPEELAVLGAADGVVVDSDQLHPEALEDAAFVQDLGEIERRLAAERPEQRLGPLLLDHGRDRLGRERLDVGRGGELRVGHDRGRVRVDEHDLVALLEQDLARLHARIVELRRLADHDRPGPDDQDLLDVSPSRHRIPSGDELQEPVEQMQRVMRTRARLGVILDAGGGDVVQHEPLDGPVVQVQMRELGRPEVGIPANRLVFGEALLPVRARDREPVVLGGDLDLPGAEVLDRVIRATVAEGKLERLEADRTAQELVTEADAEHRHLSDHLANGLDDVAERGGVTWPIRQEDGVGLVTQDVGGGASCTAAA